MALAATLVAVVFALTFAAWRRYIWAAKKSSHEPQDTCPYSLTDVFGDRPFANGRSPKTSVTLYGQVSFGSCAPFFAAQR